MKKFLLLTAVTLLFFSCATDTQKDLEQARFYLDQGDYAKAKALVEPILASEPNNNEAKFILGSALVGNFALSKKAGCKATDTGYLGILACLLDDSESTDTNGLKTFGRIAPEDSANNDDIAQAVSLLSDITTYSSVLPEKDVALQRLVARSFAISSLFQKVGANSDNLKCNSNLSDPNKDGIPDDYDTSNMTASDATLFIDNVGQLGVDAETVGFNKKFNLIKRSKAIQDDLNAFGSVSKLVAVKLLFDGAYATHTTCDL